MKNSKSNLSLKRGLLAAILVIFALVLALDVAGADPDTASITNLQNVTGQTWINWSWTNPDDADFNYTMIYLDGVFTINTSDPFYNATGLNANTTYEIGTNTVDKTGIINTSWVNQTTKTEADTTSPVISNVHATSSGTITWTTDELSDSVVKYNNTPGDYPYTESNATNVTDHRISLTGLTAGETYYYVVNSTDPSGNSNESAEYNFTFAAESAREVTPLVVIKPETLNLKSRGVFTAFIVLPEGYNVADIDLSTVKCGNATAVRGIAAGLIYIAKFKRQDLGQDFGIETIANNVTLTVSGNLSDGRSFSGSDDVAVKNGEGILGKMNEIADKIKPNPKGKEK